MQRMFAKPYEEGHIFIWTHSQEGVTDTFIALDGWHCRTDLFVTCQGGLWCSGHWLEVTDFELETVFSTRKNVSVWCLFIFFHFLNLVVFSAHNEYLVNDPKWCLVSWENQDTGIDFFSRCAFSHSYPMTLWISVKKEFKTSSCLVLGFSSTCRLENRQISIHNRPPSTTHYRWL